jgi:hypothetical protein
VQDFDATLYLVLSDRYEKATEEERAEMVTRCKGESVESIRESDLYKRLDERVVDLANLISGAGEEDPKEWLKLNGHRARRRILREVSYGGRKRTSLAAATEMLEREMPKQSRASGGGNTVVIIKPEDLDLMGKALDVTKQAKLLKPHSE